MAVSGRRKAKGQNQERACIQTKVPTFMKCQRTAEWKVPGSTKILVRMLEILIKRSKPYSINKKEASREHGKDTAKIWKSQCISKLGKISCRNGGSNASSLKEMAEEHRTGKKTRVCFAKQAY